MLFLFHAKLNKPDGMSNKEFYSLWQKESEAALAAIDAGVIKAAYKVAGKPEVYAIFDCDSADALDQGIRDLPIWKLGYAQLISDIDWIALRPYENWAEALKRLAQGG